MSVTQSELARQQYTQAPKMKLHSEEYLHKLISSQLTLSMKMFAVFVIILLGLPLANYMFPAFMNIRIFGFTLSWLFLGVLFYPITWVIAWMYVKRSIAFEEEAATWVEKE